MGQFDFTYGKNNNSAFNQDQLKGGLKRSDLKGDNELLNIFDKVDINPKDGVLDKKELSVFQQALKKFAESDKKQTELSEKETKHYLKEKAINATKEKFQEFLKILTNNPEKADGSKVKDTTNMNKDGKDFVRIEYEDGHTEDIFPDGSKVITITKNGKTITTKKDANDKELERTETETKDGKTITQNFEAGKLIEQKTVSDNGTKTETITYDGDKATKVVEDLTTGDKITSIIDGETETVISKENTKNNVKTTYEDGKEITVEGDTKTIVEGEGDDKKTTVIKKVEGGTVETITDKSGITEITTTQNSKVTVKKDSNGKILSKTEESNGQTSLTTYDGKNSITTVSKNGHNLEQTKKINGKTYTVSYDGEGNTTGIVVQYGENVKKLAKKFNCSEEALLKANGKQSGEDFKTGDVIKVPTELQADNKILRNRKSSIDAIKQEEAARLRQERWKAQDAAYRAVGLKNYKRSGETFEYGGQKYTVIGTMNNRERLLVRDSKGRTLVASHDKKILKDSYVQTTTMYDTAKNKVKGSNGKQYMVVAARNDGHGRQIALDSSGKQVVLGRNPDGTYVPLKNSYVETSDSYDILQKQIAAEPKKKGDLIKQNASLSNKDVVRFKAKDGSVWYFDTKTGKPVNLSKQEAAMITKELDAAADGWFFGLGTDEEKMIAANKKIIDPAVLAEIDKYYESKGYKAGEYKSAYEAFLSSEISDSEIYTLNADLVSNNAILNQSRRDEIISTNVITYGNKSENRNAGLAAISNRADYDNLQKSAEKYNKDNGIEGHFQDQDALQTLLYNKTKGNAAAMDSANRHLIDPNETFLTAAEIKRIQAEVGVYYIEKGSNEKAFTTQDSDVYKIMDLLLPDGQKVSDVANQADLMIAGYGEFTNEQIADEVIEYLNLAAKYYQETERDLSNLYMDAQYGFTGTSSVSHQSAEDYAAKALQLLKNEEILQLVKKELGNEKYQEIVDNIKFQSENRIDFSNLMLASNRTSELSQDDILKNRQQVENIKKLMQLAENSYLNSVDAEGFKQDFVNGLRQSMFAGTTRDDMDNYYAIAKSKLDKLTAAAEGKLVGSDGKPLPFDKAVENITGMKLDELNNEYLAHQAYGEMGLDITLGVATLPLGGAGTTKLLATGGKAFKVLNTLSKSRTAINVASSIGGGLVSGGAQYLLDSTSLATSVSGNTMQNRAMVENKSAEVGIMGAMGMGIGSQTEIIASRLTSTTGKVVTNLLGFGADLGSATYMTGVFHDGHWDEGFTLNAAMTSIGYLAGIRGAVKTRGLTNTSDLDVLLNMHKMTKEQPNPLTKAQVENLNKLTIEEAKNHLIDRGYNVEIKDNKLTYADNQAMHTLEFDSETGIVSKTTDASIKLTDDEFNKILKQMQKSDEVEFNRIKSELEQGNLTNEQIEALNNIEPKNKKAVKPDPEPEPKPEPVRDNEINLDDIQNQELKSRLENLNEHEIVEITDGENTYMLVKKDGKIQQLPEDSIIINGENIKPIKLSKEELEKIFPKKSEPKTDVNLREKLGEKLHKVYVQIEQLIEKARTLADLSSIKVMIESKFANFKTEMNALLDKLNVKAQKLKQNKTIDNSKTITTKKSEKLTKGQTLELKADDKLIIGENVLDMENLPDNIKQRIANIEDGQTIILGRNEIDPSDMTISERHLKIHNKNGKLVIEDISTNGTRVLDKENIEAYRSIKQQSSSKLNLRTNEYLSAEKAFLDATGGDYVLLNKLLSSNNYEGTYHLQNIMRSTNANNKAILETFASTGISKGNILNKSNISMDDLGLLMMFNRNNTDVQSLISNPSKVQSYLDKTNKLLDELEAQKFNFIDRQTNTFQEMDINKDLVSTIRNGGFEYQGSFVKAELNNNMLNDMEAVIHGKSYIPEFKSGTKLNKVFNETKVGDAIAVGNQMYVNNGENLIALNYDRETFEKLFPPMERFNITQGAIGDCYLVSTIDALMDSPKGRAEIYQMFSVGNDGKININIAAGNGRAYQFERFDSKGGHSIHENGLAMLEQAYAKFEIRNASKGANSGQTMINFNIDGGWMDDAAKGFLGGNAGKVYDNTEVFSRMIDAYANDSNQILQFSTILENDHFSALDPKYNIQYCHAYSVKGYNPETGMVQISNPWHSGLTIEIPKEQLLKDMSAMTIYDMAQVR